MSRVESTKVVPGGGLKTLMKDGFVRGALSAGTMVYLETIDIVTRARNFMQLKGTSKPLKVFRDNKPAKENDNDFVITIDKSRKMRLITNLDDGFVGEPELKEAFRLIKEDIKQHPVFTDGGKKKLVCRLNVDAATLSIMVDGTTKQQDHTDFNKTVIMEQFYGKAHTDNDRQYMPVVLFLALENNTRLGYYPNSHNAVMNDEQENINAAKYMYFNAGEFVIFHPLLVHFGCAYGEKNDKGKWQQGKNVRVHFYVVGESSARVINPSTGLPDTYPVFFKDSNVKVWTAQARMQHARLSAQKKKLAKFSQNKKARKVALKVLKRNAKLIASSSEETLGNTTDESTCMRSSKRLKPS